MNNSVENRLRTICIQVIGNDKYVSTWVGANTRDENCDVRAIEITERQKQARGNRSRVDSR